MNAIEPANSTDELKRLRSERAKSIRDAGGLLAAKNAGILPAVIDTTVSEILILGLILQGVKKFLVVLGHGSTEIAEVLRIYMDAGLVQVYAVRSELEASHAASALRWVTGEKAAVVTSIGPGALQAMAASLVPASDGIGVWYLLGDETTQDEGPNMQQIPGQDQAQFLKLFSQMGRAYSLHTAWAIQAALRMGLNIIDDPHRPAPYYLLLPMNVQSQRLEGFNLDELPIGAPPRRGAGADDSAYREAAEAILQAERVVVRLGGGSRTAGTEILEFLELAGGVAVVSPIALGVISHNHPRNMTVGGSKGSLSGNFAMENADLLVVVGSRAVCQSDCSRTGYPHVEKVININTNADAALHYAKTIAFIGDAGPTISKLIVALRKVGAKPLEKYQDWVSACIRQRQAWEEFKSQRFNQPLLFDPVWGREVLTQPAAIKTALDWAFKYGATCFFDAGDVQANGFQIAECERLGQVFTDTGASYMGFACSALLATGLAEKPFYGLAFSGDGSFTMNPQILIDGVQHGAKGCILVFDNRRMAAISGLQVAQYGCDFATSDTVEVDYVTWARAVRGVHGIHAGYSIESLRTALDAAGSYPGLSLIHIPVYYGPDEMGGMGVFGHWNVGNWSEETQALRHRIGL